MVTMADRLGMRGHGDDVGRDLVFPQRLDSGDVHDLPKGIVVAECLVFLLIPDRQDGTVYTGIDTQFMAGHPLEHMGRDFPYTFIVIEDPMVIGPDDEDSGGR